VLLLPKGILKKRWRQTQIESQTSYIMNIAVMNDFETHQQAERILLKFDQPALASMIQEKK